MQIDVLIVGQGLAGSILAWQLIQQRLNVLVVDDSHRGSSSVVAAGLVNPISGKRLVKSWNVDVCLPAALQFYRLLESRLNRPLYHQKPILRLFNCAQERAYWEKRRAQAGYQRYLGALADANDTAQSLDGFYIRQSGYLDTKALLGALKDFLRQQQRLLETPLNYADIHISDTGVSWKNIIADRLVFCEGQQIRNNPWFSWLPLQPAQGEILTLRTRHPLPEYIINCGKWLLPLAPDQLKIGATFQWQPLDGKPSAEGKQQLLNACRQLGWESQTDEVLEQACGVRPGTRDKKPFLGFHPSLPRLGVFNGFGAKGSLWIPYFAALFADYLCGSTKLPNEVDIKRFGFQESSRIC